MGRKKRSRRRRTRRGGCKKFQFALPFERKHEDYMNCYRACGEEEECETANEQRKKDIGNCWINCRVENVGTKKGTAALSNELTPEEEEEIDREIRELQQEMDEEELEKEMATSEGKPNWGGRRRRKKTRKKCKRRKKRGGGRNDPFYVPDPIHEKQEKKNWELFYACAYQDYSNIFKALRDGADPNWVFTYEKASHVARGLISKTIRKAGDLMRAGRDPFRGRVGEPWGLEPGLSPNRLDTLEIRAMGDLNLNFSTRTPKGERMQSPTLSAFSTNNEPYLKKINNQTSAMERIQINASGRRPKMWWAGIIGLPHGEGYGGYINLNWPLNVYEDDTPLLVFMRSLIFHAYPYRTWPFIMQNFGGGMANPIARPPDFFYGDEGDNFLSVSGCLKELLKAGATGVKENILGNSVCNNEQMVEDIYRWTGNTSEIQRKKIRRALCRIGEIEATLKGPKRGRKFDVGMGFDLKEHLPLRSGPKETVFENLSPKIGKYLGGGRKYKRRKTRRSRRKRGGVFRDGNRVFNVGDTVRLSPGGLERIQSVLNPDPAGLWRAYSRPYRDPRRQSHLQNAANWLGKVTSAQEFPNNQSIHGSVMVLWDWEQPSIIEDAAAAARVKADAAIAEAQRLEQRRLDVVGMHKIYYESRPPSGTGLIHHNPPMSDLDIVSPSTSERGQAGGYRSRKRRRSRKKRGGNYSGFSMGDKVALSDAGLARVAAGQPYPAWSRYRWGIPAGHLNNAANWIGIVSAAGGSPWSATEILRGADIRLRGMVSVSWISPPIAGLERRTFTARYKDFAVPVPAHGYVGNAALSARGGPVGDIRHVNKYKQPGGRRRKTRRKKKKTRR